jgi:hypothetical protein
MNTHAAPGTPQELIPSTYVRIPPAVVGQERPEPITEEEFYAVLARNTFTRERYEERMAGHLVVSIDDVRIYQRPSPSSRSPLSATTRQAIASVEAELEPIRRLLRQVAAGTDDPALLTDAARWLRGAAAMLDGRAVS